MAFEQSGRALQMYKDFQYQTLDSWSRTRRVVAKVEHLPGDMGETVSAEKAAKAARDAEALERQAAEAEQSARAAAEQAVCRYGGSMPRWANHPHRFLKIVT